MEYLFEKPNQDKHVMGWKSQSITLVDYTTQNMLIIFNSIRNPKELNNKYVVLEVKISNEKFRYEDDLQFVSDKITRYRRS